MDTKVTSHMTTNGCNFISYSSVSNNIIGSRGHNIPVIGCGDALVPKPHNYLNLIFFLYVLNLIRYLVCIRKFTRDNDIFVEFDPFGYSGKDFQIKNILMRCDTSRDLYLISTKPTTNNSSPPTSVVLSKELCHNYSRHSGTTILSSLPQNNFIFYNKFRNFLFFSLLTSWKINKIIVL